MCDHNICNGPHSYSANSVTPSVYAYSCRVQTVFHIELVIMSGKLAGRARVVYAAEGYIHLAKGGLDGKIVAFKDSWQDTSYSIHDWVTFQARPFAMVSGFYCQLFHILIVLTVACSLV